MFALDDRRKRARQFLESPTCARLAEWDAEVMPSGLSDVQVYSRVEWRDVSRAGRAWELLDREMRRCGRAYEMTRASAGVDNGQALLSPHDRFIQLLGEYP